MVVEWTVIRQPDDARAFAAALTVAPRLFAGRTAIGSAIEFALASVPQRSKRGTVKVYDLEVSGDGAVIQARSIALPDMSFATPGHRWLSLRRSSASQAISFGSRTTPGEL